MTNKWENENMKNKYFTVYATKIFFDFCLFASMTNVDATPTAFEILRIEQKVPITKMWITSRHATAISMYFVFAEGNEPLRCAQLAINDISLLARGSKFSSNVNLDSLPYYMYLYIRRACKFSAPMNVFVL